ncbi:hypothetical protein ES703_80345 [subsurface metagenome]
MRTIKKAGGLLLFFLIEEPKGVPHEAGSGGALDDTVKAACFDQDPHILEMDMRSGSIQEILKGYESAIL